MAYSGSNAFVQVGIATSAPSPQSLANFQALTYTNISGCVSWDGEGDATDDIAVGVLNGRVLHFVGLPDGGKSAYDFLGDDADTGQIAMRQYNNTTTNVSIRVTEGDGHFAYFSGVVANIDANQRNRTTAKGFKGEFRINSGVYRV